MSVIPGSLKFLSDWAARDDAATARAAGSFVRVEAGGSGRVPLSPRAALLVSASGQWASKNLYRSEKFAMGGPNGVRAYRVGEASGDLGFVVRTEARYALPVSGRWMRALEVGTFIDYGSVTVNRRPWPGAGSYDLQGAGNDVQTLAGDAGSIHYEQTGSLTIGTVGTTAGLHANDRVQVVLTGGESDLTVAQGVSAQGSGYAIVLAAGRRFVNTAGPNPFVTSHDGYYVVFSADHTQRELGDMASPGNLFGRTYDDDAVERLVDEFGYTLGHRMVYASRPTLVIAADNQDRHYGDANPEFTYTEVSGLVDGDDWASALQAGSLVTDADETSGVGLYDITEDPDDRFSSRLGYEVEIIDGQLEITQRPITVTANSGIKRYGQPDPEFTYTITSGNLVGSDTLGGSLTRDPGEDLGVYAIEQGTLSNLNYEITYVPGRFLILPGTASLPEAYRIALKSVQPMAPVCIMCGDSVGLLVDPRLDSDDVRGHFEDFRDDTGNEDAGGADGANG